MSDPSLTTTHQKALQVNLDSSRYGTFAEIGAGQEVVRWFFRVGGAAGTVAKSMSAYDMTVSDAIYGSSRRYVSHERLLQMLNHEFSLNVERLQDDTKRLFAFANTMTARKYGVETSYDHGWMGLRFQNHPNGPVSQVLIHVRLHDNTHILQQETVGILGVNLIHACFYENSHPDVIIEKLVDNLTRDRVEIDMIEFSGHAFSQVDNRLMSLLLVQKGVADIAMFDPSGNVLQPADALYKKPILIQRGTFRPVTHTHLDMLLSSYVQFKEDFPGQASKATTFMELTTKNLFDTAALDPKDFLDRVDALSALGQQVLITRFTGSYGLIRYLRGFTNQPIALSLGGAALVDLLNAHNYKELHGGVLEGLGQLFREEVRAYCYPQNLADGTTLTIESLKGKDSPVKHLVSHLHEQGCISQVARRGPLAISITSSEVLQLIRSGDPTWQDYVPLPVADLIKERKLFGYQGS
jgi:hypothetical protein